MWKLQEHRIGGLWRYVNCTVDWVSLCPSLSLPFFLILSISFSIYPPPPSLFLFVSLFRLLGCISFPFSLFQYLSICFISSFLSPSLNLCLSQSLSFFLPLSTQCFNIIYKWKLFSQNYPNFFHFTSSSHSLYSLYWYYSRAFLLPHLNW